MPDDDMPTCPWCETAPEEDGQLYGDYEWVGCENHDCGQKPYVMAHTQTTARAMWRAVCAAERQRRAT